MSIPRRIPNPLSRTVPLQDDLDAVTTVSAHEQPPEAGGLGAKRAAVIWRAIQALYDSGVYPGIQFCLMRRGEIVFDRAVGHAWGNGPGDPEEEAPRLLSPDTPICLFSSSKAITAVLVHKMAELGHFSLDDPIADIIPEFAAENKGHITVSEMLSHRGGIPQPPGEGDTAELTDWNEIVRRLCAAPLHRQRKQKMSYHAVTGGFILGEVIRRATGKELKPLMTKYLQKPLGLRTFNFGIAKSRMKEVARNYVTGPPIHFPLNKIAERALGSPWETVVDLSNTPPYMSSVIPAANIISTARETALFYQMLLDGGQAQDGTEVLAPETVARAIKPVGHTGFDRMLLTPMRYSEGFMLGLSPAGLYGPFTAKAFGHLGFINILTWADPAREIACSLITTGKPLISSHIAILAATTATISAACDPRLG